MYDLYVVDANKHPEHWRAWKEWYHRALRRSFFPVVATTLFAWPPTDPAEVQLVLAWLRKMQEDAKAEARSRKLAPPSLAPVPDIAPVYHRQPPTFHSRIGAA